VNTAGCNKDSNNNNMTDGNGNANGNGMTGNQMAARLSFRMKLLAGGHRGMLF